MWVWSAEIDRRDHKLEDDINVECLCLCTCLRALSCSVSQSVRESITNGRPNSDGSNPRHTTPDGVLCRVFPNNDRDLEIHPHPTSVGSTHTLWPPFVGDGASPPSPRLGTWYSMKPCPNQ
mmetsp:Transcript_12177/g.13357  ORF Transcript_12177/g.13357 Transcript_12177/m.13357 type:complete len:121 (-) Transcript_12177:413-775(-)